MSYSVSKMAYGRWDFIFSQILPEVKQNTKHQPCPICGGKDRFRLFKDWVETGSGICNQCEAGNGFTWLMRSTGQSFNEVSNAVLSQINPAFRRGSSESFRYAYNKRQIKIREDRLRGELEQREQQVNASIKVQKYWCCALPADHAYLIKKQLPTLNTKSLNDLLLIPLQDVDGYLWNIQSVNKEGFKRFFAGGRVKGLFSCVGGDIKKGSRVYISEGWATAATIHLETGCVSLAAMNAGNLESVARQVFKRYPSIEIVIAGDDDRSSESNIGRTKATSAALSVGAGLAFPSFCSYCTCSDFNDVSICHGELKEAKL